MKLVAALATGLLVTRMAWLENNDKELTMSQISGGLGDLSFLEDETFYSKDEIDEGETYVPMGMKDMNADDWITEPPQTFGNFTESKMIAAWNASAIATAGKDLPESQKAPNSPRFKRFVEALKRA